MEIQKKTGSRATVQRKTVTGKGAGVEGRSVEVIVQKVGSHLSDVCFKCKAKNLEAKANEVKEMR